MAAVQRFTLRQGRSVDGAKGSEIAHAEQKRFDGLTAVGQERSRGVAIARRFLDFGGGLDPLVYHFDFVTDDGQVVLSSKRQRTVRDSYEITIPVLSDGSQLDWRVGAAMAVALDVLQGR